MILQLFLRWIMQFVLPVLGWRVPVCLLRGVAPDTGRQVVLLSAGGTSEFIWDRFFAEEPEVVRSTRVPVWRLQRLVDAWSSEADLTQVRVDRISARLFLRKGGHLVVPEQVNPWTRLPTDMNDFLSTRRDIRREAERARKRKYDYQISRSIEDFNEFYDRHFRPFVIARHGARAAVTPRWRLRLFMRSGMLMWGLRDGVRVSGGLLEVKDGQYHILMCGLLDGREDLMKDGALCARYVHAFYHAASLGCTELHMGGSHPSLHDGVFHYKSKWATDYATHVGFVSGNMVMQISWQRLEGAVAEFLSRTSLVFHDQEGFSAIWVFPQGMPLTTPVLKQQCARLRARGLRTFVVLLPAEPPPDFVSPPEVLLLPMSAAAHGPPEVQRGASPKP